MFIKEMSEVRIFLNSPSFSMDIMRRIGLFLDPPKVNEGALKA